MQLDNRVEFTNWILVVREGCSGEISDKSLAIRSIKLYVEGMVYLMFVYD